MWQRDKGGENARTSLLSTVIVMPWHLVNMPHWHSNMSVKHRFIKKFFIYQAWKNVLDENKIDTEHKINFIVPFSNNKLLIVKKYISFIKISTTVKSFTEYGHIWSLETLIMKIECTMGWPLNFRAWTQRNTFILFLLPNYLY